MIASLDRRARAVERPWQVPRLGSETGVREIVVQGHSVGLRSEDGAPYGFRDLRDEIGDGSDQCFSVILEVTEHMVAATTKQATHPPRFVAMIYMKDAMRLAGWFAMTDGATAALRSQHFLIVCEIDAVFADKMPLAGFGS